MFTISDNCLYTTGHRCINGACLDSQCHCNDGWGGKGCSMPDENECKYRSVLLWNTLYIICILFMIYCNEIHHTLWPGLQPGKYPLRRKKTIIGMNHSLTAGTWLKSLKRRRELQVPSQLVYRIP